MIHRTIKLTIFLVLVLFPIISILSTLYIISSTTKLYNNIVPGCIECPETLSFREILSNILGFKHMYNLRAPCDNVSQDCNPDDGDSISLSTSEFCYICTFMMSPIISCLIMTCITEPTTEELYCGQPSFRLSRITLSEHV